MIRCLLLRWNLAADERYLHMLENEGWTDPELRGLRHRCETLRVELALCPLTDRTDAIVLTASIAALAALALILLQE